jgi:D-beta-D-heptose 7-phosphate kinase/D-beta-D-heptose 1-phosphate adenosyltransferase
VGINNDDSVKRLKGDQRPIQDESTRSNILAAIESVDAVCLFEDETPLDLIQMITPDVLIKGADYKIENVVGASHVTANGGEVRLIDLVLGESTTNTISRIKLT